IGDRHPIIGVWYMDCRILMDELWSRIADVQSGKATDKGHTATDNLLVLVASKNKIENFHI
ncbi:hypothetical protein, partial [Brachymonas sp. M4Q-1]|uniref:hypothetical protein n=1 Tax=Brachymonas sp. M4Q-1 TaxID=3416906 RepID=UPI003CE852D1